MLSWLAKYFGSIAGTVGSAVSNAIHYAVHALASVVFSVFGLVGRAWDGLAGAISRFHHYLDVFAQAVVDFAHYVIKTVIPSVVKWAATQLTRLENFITAVWNDLKAAVVALIKRIEAAATAVTNWAIKNIWDPLKKFADLIWADLLKWGYTAWYYITHPDKLAELLINDIVTSLERHAWSIAQRLGSFTLALISRNLPRIIQLIEDILTAVI